jgi:hypothetical protein
VAVLAAATASEAFADCDPLVVKYDGTSWWWNAFGTCKRPGGPTRRDAILDCAWSQVPATDRLACLKERLRQTEQTRQAIDSVAAQNLPRGNCDQLVVKYDGSNGWWGAFGNCKRPGGPFDRAAIFDCAWNQVPANERRTCLRRRLQQTEQTRRGIDDVAASIGPSICDRLMVKYDGSSSWERAFGKCRPPGGPTDREAILDCAWEQVPAGDKRLCLKERLARTEQTRKAIDAVAAYNSVLPRNSSTASFDTCADPGSGCQEACDLPSDGSVPAPYFAPQIPQFLLDAPVPSFNTPPAHNIGANEGRLRPDLRAAARLADPLGCSLQLSSIHFALGRARLARAFADLAVTGRRAFAAFRRARPGETYCQSLASRTLSSGCPAPAGLPAAADLVAGCRRTLDRAYAVANHLRTGQALQANPGKVNERNALGWIAVSGEDDAPHRPVNVPSSDFPQYDLDVLVPAPLARPPHPPVVRVATRYVIAQSRPPALAAVGPVGWTLRPEPPPAIGPNAEVLIFVHGMDSRAEEATDITTALFRRMKGSSRNLVVIAVDLPTSGYAANLDYDRVSPLDEIGEPGISALQEPVPIPPEALAVLTAVFVGVGLPPPPPVIPPGTPFPDFVATGRVPVLDFIEEFVVRFVNALDARVPIKDKVKAVMGGSLGGNISFRLGRRGDLLWLPAVAAWSPASIWHSLGEGRDRLKRLGPGVAWKDAANRDPSDPNDLGPRRAGLRRDFFDSWDKPIVPVLVDDAQSDTWKGDNWPCKQADIAAARLERHETYDPRFLSWHWRLGAEQLLYSHQTVDATDNPRYMFNHKRMFLACGTEDNVPYNEICNATQRTVPHMTMTPGKALFMQQTGHSLHIERRDFFAAQLDQFLGLRLPGGRGVEALAALGDDGN